jgi:hypothetical protein
VDQAVICGGRERARQLQRNSQNRVRRHRPMRRDPRLDSFAGQIFRNENEMIILNSESDGPCDVGVVERLNRACLFFELLTRAKLDNRRRNKLEREWFARADAIRFVSDRLDGARDFFPRAVVVPADAVMVEKNFAFHNSCRPGSDSPANYLTPNSLRSCAQDWLPRLDSNQEPRKRVRLTRF